MTAQLPPAGELRRAAALFRAAAAGEPFPLRPAAQLALAAHFDAVAAVIDGTRHSDPLPAACRTAVDAAIILRTAAR